MVSVSNLVIEPEEIVDFLKREIRLQEVCKKILFQRIISKAAQEREVAVTPEEIQAEADRQRYERRLESSASTLAWLSEQLITPEDWEAGILDRLLADKFAKSLFAKEAEKYFAEHRLDFEQILLYRITVPYEQLAQELFYQIEESEISFYEAAHLYDVDERRRKQCGYEGILYRWSLKPELAAIVFGQRLGEVIGPLKTEQGYDLLMVEEILTAELTPKTHEEIIDRLFQAWLESELTYLIAQD
jgi:parvulin-like peptidyl-prolyl isomerase